MKFTLSWLKRHLDTQASVDAIGARLTMLGLEVESLEDPAARLGGFITGHILEAGKHPNADRLQLCKVSIGRETLQVVCGAPNARAGLKVVVATPGVVVPATGEALKKGNVRGVESQGMMCSWRELLLGEDHSGIIELPADTPVGVPLTKVLSFDPVIDVAITPNRADCLGVRGIARDLAAAGVGTLKPLPVEPVKSLFPCPVKVSVNLPAEARDACPLFAGRVIRGVRNGESPAWLKSWLNAVGVRPISALVDITNYFTLDLNRPLHVFDVKKLQGASLDVRLAHAGESFVALNGKTYALDGTMTAIADEAGVESLGGVIGGEATGVSAATTDVFVESAYFDPISIARTGRALACESDARYRFERGIDPAFVIPGLELASRMIIEVCGGEASEPVVVGAPPASSHPIVFRPHRVALLGGVEVPETNMVAGLEGLGCILEKARDGYLVTPPSWRADLTGEHDLVEEVIRIWGYDSIPAVSMPRPAVVRPVLTASQKQAGWVRRALAVRGLVETVTWSFQSRAVADLFGGGAPALLLANPISSDLDAMRPSLLGNLLSAAGRNADRGLKDIALFELGPEFHGDRPEDQHPIAAAVRAGRAGARHWGQPARSVDAFDAKADALAAIQAAGGPADGVQTSAQAPAWYHPGRSGSLKLGTKVLATFGEVHPRVLSALGLKGPMVAFELSLDALPSLRHRATKAKSLLKLSPFQAIERDFAFVVESDVSADTVVRAVKGADKVLISDVLVFDLYEGAHVGEGKKSLALQVTLQPVEKTLTDAEIEAVGLKIVAAVGKATGGVLRA